MGESAKGSLDPEFAVRISPYAVAAMLRACAQVGHQNQALFDALTWRLRRMGAAEVLASMGLVHALHILEAAAKLRYRNFELLQAAVSRLVEVRGDAEVSGPGS